MTRQNDPPRFPADAACSRQGCVAQRSHVLGGVSGFFFLLLLFAFSAVGRAAAEETTLKRPTLVIPRVERAPVFEAFLNMNPDGAAAEHMAKVEGFVQRKPKDGAPSTKRTVVYLGYDASHLYAVWVCFDTEPDMIRARMSIREQIDDTDDYVSLQIDTFHDQRRAYGFTSNPLGIQQDSIWTEGQGWDDSFDTIWYSKGKLTDKGYVLWMAIPFRSLRFSSEAQQTWGILLNRHIPRLNECTFWPEWTMRIEGKLNQAATLRGLENISPGRNMQFNPYLFVRSYHALDLRDPARPRFQNRDAATDVGLDTKVVLKDSLVVDVTLNPDFSQVESDEPQVTVNQRFEVFFPEKRSFFIENADYFRTPLNLVFTRRIADPQFGVRLTGKLGPYGLGVLFADDQAPGKTAAPGSPWVDERAYFTIVRLTRDVRRQSRIGLIFTDREFHGSFNRVGGVDARVKFSPNWVATLQGLASSTRLLDGNYVAGPGYLASLQRSGKHLAYSLEYKDLADSFRSLPGFVERTDIRSVFQVAEYSFRPANTFLDAWGPRIQSELIWDHHGRRLRNLFEPSISWSFRHETSFGLHYCRMVETLRPHDFSVLLADKDFPEEGRAVSFHTSFARWISFDGRYWWGRSTNYVPPAGREPELARWNYAQASLILRPFTPLRIEHSYLLHRLRSFQNENISTNHIVRSKWNWQFNRELSLRLIVQYNTVHANPARAFLQTTKNLNTDVLITYLLHPGTAPSIGYNSNLQNLDPALISDPLGLCRTNRTLINDGRQFFFKLSYLLRF